MNPDKDHIKKVFASKLEGFEKEPPAFMWEKIESGLPLPNKKPKTRKLIYQMAGWGAVAAAVLIAFFLFLPNDIEQSQQQVAQNQSVLPSETKDTTSIEGNAQADQTQKEVIIDQQPIVKNQYTSKVLVAKANDSSEKKDVVLASNTNKTLDETKNESVEATNALPVRATVLTASASVSKKTEKEETESKEDLQQKIDKFAAEGLQSEKLLAENIDSQVEKSANTGLALGVNGGGAFSKADAYKRTVLAMANSDQQLTLRSETVKLEHNQPITFGLSINKRINDRFSVESGITYTYLSSKIKSSAASTYSQSNMQYLHYLGIPLTINYNVIEWNKIRVYLAAGGAVQKDIYGRVDKRSVNLSESGKSHKSSISQRNVQMSITSSLGISYPIYNNMSLYTTVGGAYYIDAKNEYETIYSDKQWLLNLNLGIKFGF